MEMHADPTQTPDGITRLDRKIGPTTLSLASGSITKEASGVASEAKLSTLCKL